MVELINTKGARLVGNSGPATAKIAFVGEAPGSTEVATGQPFVGAAGKLLDRLMNDVGILRSECYFTNVIKEQPPNNDISKFIDFSRGRAKPTPAYEHYEQQLYEELKGCRANVIVALGDTALYALTGLLHISKRRGSIYQGKTGHKVVACLHPAAALRQYIWEHFIRADLRRARVESNSPALNLPARNLQVRPSFDDAMQYLLRCKEARQVGFDIEVSMNSKKMTCFSLALSAGDCMSIPLQIGYNDYFNPDQETQIIRALDNVLSDNSIAKWGQNIVGFDSPYMFWEYGITLRNVEDTMIAHSILFPDFPKGLDFLTSMYTREPYYKDEGKYIIKRDLQSQSDAFWIYNAKDSAVVMEIWPKLERDLKLQGNWETYCAQRDLHEPLRYISMRGIKVNVDGLRKAALENAQELQALQAQFDRQTGGGINPASPKSLKQYFYGTLGLHPYTKRKTGAVTVDEEALKRIAKKGVPAADTLLKIRKSSKLQGTYFEMQFDTDDRVRCSMNPVGTAFGRLSSSQTVRDTGGNFQNMPPKFKKYLVADEGYLMFEKDLAKAENVCVAYMGPEPTMIRAFEQDIDLHKQTAGLIFNKPIEQVSKEKGSSTIGNGEGSERDWGKKANHAFNYAFGYRAFSQLYELPETEAKWIYTCYHSAYPGVSHNYWPLIQSMLRQGRKIKNPFGRIITLLDRWGDELFKQGYAALPQSTIADKMNRQGLLFLTRNSHKFQGLEILNCVHDSVVCQVPLSLGWDTIAAYILALKESLETPIEFMGRSFVVKADLKVGYAWGELDEIKYPKQTDMHAWLTQELERVAAPKEEPTHVG